MKMILKFLLTLNFLLILRKPSVAASHPSHNATESVTQREHYSKITTVLNQLLSGYDKRLRPNFGGDPLTIEANMHVTSLVPINEVDMEFTTMFFLRQRWKDSRLAYQGLLDNPSITMKQHFVQHIWLPDAFFDKDLSDHQTRDDLLVRIYPDGKIIYSVRKKVKAYCPMEFQEFPFDMQKCELKMESYAYTTKDIIYKWIPGKTNSITFSKELKLMQYSLKSWDVTRRTTEYSTGNFSVLAVKYAFERKIGFYLIGTYIPSALIVVISWVGFWIDERSTPARVSLAITTVLAITTLLFAVQSSFPKVGHIKAIDIYLLGDFFFVFGALVEYAIICYLNKRGLSRVRGKEKRKDEINDVDKKSTSNGVVAFYTEEQNDQIPNPMSFTNLMLNNTELKERNTVPEEFGQSTQMKQTSNHSLLVSNGYSIDEKARVLFPLAYLSFLLIYMILCIHIGI